MLLYNKDLKGNTFSAILMIWLIYTIGFKDMNIKLTRGEI